MTRESPREEIFLLGLDLGVSTVKAALFNSRGLLIEVESDEYIIMPEGGKVEADPATYWTPLAAANGWIIARNWRRMNCPI